MGASRDYHCCAGSSWKPVWAFTSSYAIARLVGVLLGWKVPKEAEYFGLDILELGEEAYETI